jgi:hypothetical protein
VNDIKSICLCHCLGNSDSIIGIKINVNYALKLPSLCKVNTPPVKDQRIGIYNLIKYIFY